MAAFVGSVSVAVSHELVMRHSIYRESVRDSSLVQPVSACGRRKPYIPCMVGMYSELSADIGVPTCWATALPRKGLQSLEGVKSVLRKLLQMTASYRVTESQDPQISSILIVNWGSWIRDALQKRYPLLGINTLVHVIRLTVSRCFSCLPY